MWIKLFDTENKRWWMINTDVIEAICPIYHSDPSLPMGLLVRTQNDYTNHMHICSTDDEVSHCFKYIMNRLNEESNKVIDLEVSMQGFNLNKPKRADRRARSSS